MNFPRYPNMPLSACPGAEDEATSPRRESRKRYRFKIVKNNGGGDCLFLTLAEFLKKSDPQVHKDTLRHEIVNYIVGSTGPAKSASVWSRYRHGVKLALERHVPFFQGYSLENEDERTEERAREEYQNYMNQPHVYGTYVELCAAMEKYAFHTTLIEEVSSQNGNAYNICHLDAETCRNIRKRAYIAFTGSIDSGHFEFLQPVKPRYPKIPKGLYEIEGSQNQMDFLTLIFLPKSPSENQSCTSRSHTDETDPSFPSKLHPNHLKRPLHSIVSASSSGSRKKPRFLEGMSEPSESECITQHPLFQLLQKEMNDNVRPLLFQYEIQALAQAYTSSLSKLKENFEKSQEDQTGKNWPGVSHSDVEKYGPFHTVFFQFEANAFISLNPVSAPLYAIVHHDKVLSVDEFEASGEQVCQSSKSREFVLEPGKLYTLENHTEDLVLVRLLWTEIEPLL
jgi:hypothetical protein